MMRLRNFSAAALSRFAVTTASKTYLAFMVDSAPEIAELAVDLHERLIQMPPPLRIPAHVRQPLLSDLGGEHRAESVPPKPDRLMADVDPALGQEILDVAQRQRVLHVHQHRQTDYLGRAVEIAERAAHGPSLPRAEAPRAFGLTKPFLPPVIASVSAALISAIASMLRCVMRR